MKTIKFSKSGNTVKVFDYDDEQVTDKLAPAVYSVDKSLFGFYLNVVSDKFQVPDKIYGNTIARAKKIIKSYDDRDVSTGVLLTGDKGSGKTLLTSILGNMMIDRGVPVVMIEKPFAGTDFNELLSNLGEAMLMFDEFGKTYDKNKPRDENAESQNSLLSVFDGARSRKRLILLTENEAHSVNSYMINRPGRVYYHFKYNKVSEDVIREYCSAHNIEEDIIQSILLRVESSYEFSFDALKAVVEEYLRFGEDIKEIFSNLNIEEGKVRDDKMKVVKVIDSKNNKELDFTTTEISYPFSGYDDRIYYKTGEKYESGEDKLQSIELCVEDLVERTATRHIYNLEEDEIVVILDKIPYQERTGGWGRYLDVGYN